MHDIQKKLHDAFLNKTSTEVPGTIGVGEGSSSDAVKFYRSGYLTRIRESMDDRFHVFQKVYEDYSELREKYIFENPSTFYSLDDYGLTFSKWLKEKKFPILMSDLALLEERLDLFTRNFSKESIEIVGELNLEKTIKLNGVDLVHLTSPVYDLWYQEKPLTLEGNNSDLIMIYYDQNDVVVKKLVSWQFALLQLFQLGSTLSHAMENIDIPENKMTDFKAFFEFLGQNKLLKTN